MISTGGKLLSVAKCELNIEEKSVQLIIHLFN